MTRRSMLRAALAYVDVGWPIVPGATPYGARRRRIRVDGGFGPAWVGCSCDSQYCVSPAAHPIDPQWQRHLITTAADAKWWWSGRSGALPNILLACGAAFHVWSVPRAVGARVLEKALVEVAHAIPVAATPTGWWHLFTAPEGAPEELPPIPADADVAHFGDGCAVPAPPSTRGALGHHIWLREPATRRLASCGVVAAAVLRAVSQTTSGDAHRPSDGIPPLWRAVG